MQKVMKVLAQTKYQDQIPSSFAYKFVCVDDKFSKQIVFYRGENAANKFIEEILEEYKYIREVIKKEQFGSSNICWICEKRIENDDEKVWDHCT